MSNSFTQGYLYSPTVIDPFKKVPPVTSVEDGTKVNLVSPQGNYDLTIVKKLGAGGFGSVYKCKDIHGAEYALKKIESKKDRGIPCLFEASMMTVYTHPSINRAILVNATPEGLYILQDIAKYDLHGLIRYNEEHSIKMTMLQHKNILYRVVKGLSFLHEKGLVHGDVKCSNVLYYSDNDIRLSDFNLSTMKKWKSNIHLCTAIYRPLEIWDNKDWNEKIDIWSLGCMMYELMYHSCLFPYQGEADDPRSKRDLRRKYMNAIIDWAHFNSPDQIKSDKYSTSYRALNIASELMRHKGTDIIGKSRDTYDYDKELYINLMLRCLQVLDKYRPTIDSIISDQFFQVMRSKTEIKILFSTPIIRPKINQDLYNIIEKDLVNYVGPSTGIISKELLRVATHICSMYAQIVKYDNHLIKKVSVWIAKKLLRSDSKSQELPNLGSGLSKEQILQLEIEICNTLGFKLHNI